MNAPASRRAAARHASKTSVIAALAGDALIAVTKFVAAGMTGSSAMLSEAFHSCADSCNQLLLLYGLRASAAAPDKFHPYGYGKELYFWSFVVAVVVFSMGAGVSVYEGVTRLRHPEPLGGVLADYLVLAVAAVFEAASWSVAVREFQRRRTSRSFVLDVHRSKDPSLIAVLFEDSAAILGLIIAFAGITAAHRFHAPQYDAWASIAIGAVLAVVAGWLAYESKGLLVGEAVDPRTLEDIRAVIAADARVVRLIAALTMHLGPDDVLLTLDVDFADRLSTTEVEDTIVDLERRIQERHPEVTRIFIEAKSWSRRRRGPEDRRQGDGGGQNPNM